MMEHAGEVLPWIITALVSLLTYLASETKRDIGKGREKIAMLEKALRGHLLNLDRRVSRLEGFHHRRDGAINPVEMFDDMGHEGGDDGTV